MASKKSVRANGVLARELREKMNLSQEELAERAGVHENTIGNLERGRYVSSTILSAVAQRLGVLPDNLIDEEAPPSRARKPRSQTATVAATFSQSRYWLGAHSTEAIRLSGADSEFFPPKNIEIEINNSIYDMPLKIRVVREEILERLKREAKEKGRQFFDGPHTRLVDFRATPRDATEEKHLELTLGPIDWYDYSVVNEVYAQHKSIESMTIDGFIDLDEVADGCIRNVKLTNILCTDITILTLDG